MLIGKGFEEADQKVIQVVKSLTCSLIMITNYFKLDYLLIICLVLCYYIVLVALLVDVRSYVLNNKSDVSYLVLKNKLVFKPQVVNVNI